MSIVKFFALLGVALWVNPCDALANGGKSRPVIPKVKETKQQTTVNRERQPWDVLRFVKQSSKFVRFPNPLASSAKKNVIMPGDLLWSNEKKRFALSPLDDVVMGGASASTIDQSTGLWTGFVTDANSGGFVGIRSTPVLQPALDMSACQGVELKFGSPSGKEMNGKRLKMGMRDSTDFNGIVWTTSFPLRTGSSIKIPFSKQVPTLFAKTVPNQTFDDTNVSGFQLVYSKFEYDGELNPKFALGDFGLQIVEIKAY